MYVVDLVTETETLKFMDLRSSSTGPNRLDGLVEDEEVEEFDLELIQRLIRENILEPGVVKAVEDNKAPC